MKKRLVILMTLIGIFAFVNVNAQSKMEVVKVDPSEKNPSLADPSAVKMMKEDCQNVMKMKKEYFKANMKLSDKETVDFWPLFDRYLMDEESIHQQFKQTREEKGIKRENGVVNFDLLKDDEIIYYYDSKFEMRSKLLELDSKFYQSLKKVLAPKTLVQYYNLEKSFKNYIVKEVKPDAATDGAKSIDVKKCRR
jgi:hypothetical protein